MRRLGFLALALALASPAHAGEVIQRGTTNVRVQLDAMPKGQLVVMLMRDVMGVPYVIAPEVLADNKPISVNLTMPRADLPLRVVQFLRGIGLTVTLRGGTVYVTRGPLPDGVTPGSSLPSGNPAAGSAAPIAVTAPGYDATTRAKDDTPPSAYSGRVRPVVQAVIVPAHKPVDELAGVLEAILPDLTIASRDGTAPKDQRLVDRLEPDSLVVSGPVEVVDRAVEIVRAIDRPRPKVEIRAVVFEVRNSNANSSAISLLAEVAGVSLSSGAGSVPGDQFVRIATGGIRAVLSATKGDNRFKVVAEPSLLALSGSVATLNSGSQVPTLGSVTFSDNGTPTRSVVYRDSGLTLSVRPVVRPGGIELSVEQERSSFVRTTTGVDDSPTLNKASASATVSLQPGETVALAGLDEHSDTFSRSGIFGGLLSGKSREHGEGQSLLLLQADVVEQSDGPGPAVTMFGVDDDGDDGA